MNHSFFESRANHTQSYFLKSDNRDLLFKMNDFERKSEERMSKRANSQPCKGGGQEDSGAGQQINAAAPLLPELENTKQQ